MPCYEVNTVSVEFSGRSIAVLRAIGGRVEGEIVKVDGVSINMATGMASGRQSAINAVKRKYSEQVVKSIAKGKGWQVKEVKKGVYQAVKY